MKRRPSVKKICKKCKTIRRNGKVMVICQNKKHKQNTKLKTQITKPKTKPQTKNKTKQQKKNQMNKKQKPKHK